MVEINILYFSNQLHYCGGAVCILPHTCESVCGQRSHGGFDWLPVCFLQGNQCLLLSGFCYFYPETFIAVGRFDVLRYIVEHVKIVSPHIIFIDIKSCYEFHGVCVKIYNCGFEFIRTNPYFCAYIFCFVLSVRSSHATVSYEVLKKENLKLPFNI